MPPWYAWGHMGTPCADTLKGSTVSQTKIILTLGRFIANSAVDPDSDLYRDAVSALLALMDQSGKDPL